MVSSGVLEPPAPGARPEKNIVVPAPGMDLAKGLRSQRTWKELPVLSLKKANSLKGFEMPKNLPIFFDSDCLKIPGSGGFFDSHFSRYTRG